MDDREQARRNGIGRAVLGTGLMLAPGLAGRVWLGSEASTTGAQVATRALGVRDVVLGAGLAMALDNREPVRAWVVGAAAADAIDAAATLIAWGRLPRAGRVLVLALATTSMVQLGVLARRLS